MSAEFLPVVLVGLPVERFDATVSYLGDVLRECQLLLVGRSQGTAGDAGLLELAQALVPELEGLREVFRSAEISAGDEGYRAWAEMRGTDAELLADLQVHLIRLRVLGRGGEMLVASDPAISEFVTWVCEELADQLSGRPPRPYRP